jgi:hypothetical protein
MSSPYGQPRRHLKAGRGLSELPTSLPDVYAHYLKSVNPKTPGVENGLPDDYMLRAAKMLAKLALGSDYIPKGVHARSWTALSGSECSNFAARI